MQDIYIDDIGDGFPLVLVHGFLGSSEMWKLQKQKLKDNFRIISPALPGFGESYKSKSLKNIEDMAYFILNCIEEKKIYKFHLMGHSMGGMIAQEIVKISGSRINKLICFATGSIGEMPGRFETIDDSILKIKKEGIKKSLKRIPKTWFVKGKEDKNYNFCESAVMNLSEETAINALVAMKNWRSLEYLKNIKNETLIIWGDKDKSYNFEQIDTLNKNIPNSNLKILNGCSHNAHLEEPDLFNNLVEEFLT